MPEEGQICDQLEKHVRPQRRGFKDDEKMLPYTEAGVTGLRIVMRQARARVNYSIIVDLPFWQSEIPLHLYRGIIPCGPDPTEQLVKPPFIFGRTTPQCVEGEHLDFLLVEKLSLTNHAFTQINNVKYHRIEPSQTLAQCLQGKRIIEYPVFLVLLPGEARQYPLLDAKSESGTLHSHFRSCTCSKLQHSLLLWNNLAYSQGIC